MYARRHCPLWLTGAAIAAAFGGFGFSRPIRSEKEAAAVTNGRWPYFGISTPFSVRLGQNDACYDSGGNKITGQNPCNLGYGYSVQSSGTAVVTMGIGSGQDAYTVSLGPNTLVTVQAANPCPGGNLCDDSSYGGSDFLLMNQTNTNSRQAATMSVQSNQGNLSNHRIKMKTSNATVGVYGCGFTLSYQGSTNVTNFAVTDEAEPAVVYKYQNSPLCGSNTVQTGGSASIYGVQDHTSCQVSTPSAQ